MQDRKDEAAQQAPGEAAAEIHEQQHTGNHDKPAKERRGNERFGGTRKGAENVEPKR